MWFAFMDCTFTDFHVPWKGITRWIFQGIRKWSDENIKRKCRATEVINFLPLLRILHIYLPFFLPLNEMN